MKKIQWREHFSSKHNLMAKRQRIEVIKEKIQHRRIIKPKFGQKIKIKLLMAMLFIQWLIKKIKK